MAARANIAKLRQRLAEEDVVPKSPKEPPTLQEALHGLFSPPDKTTDEIRQEWLQVLGSGKDPRDERDLKNDITEMHEKLAEEYQRDEKSVKENDKHVLNKLLDLQSKAADTLGNLFAHGQDGLTILHVVLDPATYSARKGFKEFHFDRVKPLIRFLLRLHPRLPAVESTDGKGPPIFKALRVKPITGAEVPVFNPETKAEIVSFLWEKDGLRSTAAMGSLVQTVWSQASYQTARHALHVAIESADFGISEAVVKQLIKIDGLSATESNEHSPSLDIQDGQGRTCLHVALTSPFNKQKAWWAEKLAELRPDLLKATYKIERGDKVEHLTPLQHFAEQTGAVPKEPKRESDDDEIVTDLDADLVKLEAKLKRHCLVNFDYSTCMRVMYKKDNSKTPKYPFADCQSGI